MRPCTIAVTSTLATESTVGDVAVNDMVEEQFTWVAGIEPNAIDVPPTEVENPVPVTVTTVPPAIRPVSGTTALTTGGGPATMTFPLVSTAAQKVLLVQETELAPPDGPIAGTDHGTAGLL